jgi:hypothetical protein
MPCPKNTPVMGMVLGKIFSEYRSIKPMEWMDIIVSREFTVDRLRLFLIKKNTFITLFYLYSFLGLRKS